MSVHLIEDTRQKQGQHEIKNEGWRRMGVYVIRCRLPFGDYAPVPPVSVDTKKDIYEIANNIRNDHGRFRKECIEADKHGCTLVFLIENDEGVTSLDDLKEWRESARHFKERHGKEPFEGRTLAKSMSTMADKYGVRFEFCKPEEAHERVQEIIESFMR